MSTQTHIQVQKQQALSLKEKVCMLLFWSEQAYAEFQYEAGLYYLSIYIPTDDQGRRWLEDSKLFWNWWKNHWMIRDQQFCTAATERLSLNSRLNEYTNLHDARVLAECIYPNSIILHDSYHDMISKVIDNENQIV